ncbi:MAG: hypothetical protein IIB36_10600 [Gemmatimonadetes bacterium]|nr:hypothetical protein [Gemmatimonadota bacterium]
MPSQRGTTHGWFVLLVSLLLLGAEGVHAQGTARLRAEENFRRTPNGEVIARLNGGVRMQIVGRRGNWVQVDLEGWMWTRSLQVSTDAAFELVVSEPEGENLRDTPSGTILGRLRRGTLLEEVRRVPGWILIRRRGWVWGPSVAEVADVPTPVSPTSPTPSPPSTSRPVGFLDVGANGAVILAAPDGDTLARAAPRAQLEVTARQGNWVRVRVEGWIWQPDTPTSEDGSDEPAVLSPDDVAVDPDAFAGRVVSWRLQFISQEKAEAVRTDFFEGEPFLLCRFGGEGGQFVYVAVPPDRLAEVEGLVPLEFLTVTARVRTGASVLTGTPIVDLLSVERERRRL